MRVLIFCLMISTALTASARIGETLQECEKRYGVGENHPERNAVMFKTAEYTIIVCFFEGVAEMLGVLKDSGRSRLSVREIEVFLNANADDWFHMSNKLAFSVGRTPILYASIVEKGGLVIETAGRRDRLQGKQNKILESF